MRKLVLVLFVAGLTACGPGKKPEKEKPPPSTEEEKIDHQLDELVKTHGGWLVADRDMARIPESGETEVGKLIVNKGFYKAFVRGGDAEVIIIRPQDGTTWTGSEVNMRAQGSEIWKIQFRGKPGAWYGFINFNR